MTVMRQLVPGSLILASLSIATVALITAPGRARIADLHAEAVDLAERERDLMKRFGAMQAAETEQLGLPEELFWGAESTKPIDVALQELLVSAAGSAGLQLVKFGPSTTGAKTVLPALSFELEMAGTHEGLARFLADIESKSPALAVSYLWLRQLPPIPEQAGAPLNIRLTIWCFRKQFETP